MSAHFLSIAASGPYLEYTYNDYGPYVAVGEGEQDFGPQLRAKAYLTEIAMVVRDITAPDGTVLFAAVPLVKVEEDDRISYAIGNDGTIATVADTFTCAPFVYVIESVGGNFTATSQDVYDEIRILLAT